jgi:large conductance mechanosensitive channel
MGLIAEFKEFALKGNAVDLAVGVVIGAAFGKIVTSIVNDIIMPPIGLLTGGVDFSAIKIFLKHGDPTAKPAIPDVTVNIGLFINTVIEFLIVAISIFIVIKLMNTLTKKKEEAPAPAAPPAPTKEELLLTDIRDILKTQAKA